MLKKIKEMMLDNKKLSILFIVLLLFITYIVHTKYLFYSIILLPLLGVVSSYLFKRNYFYGSIVASILTFTVTFFYTGLYSFYGSIEGINLNTIALSFYLALVSCLPVIILILLGEFSANLIKESFNKNNENIFKKALQFGTSVFIIVSLLLLLNTFVGNPISKAIARNNAEEYLNVNHKDTDLHIDDIFYSFKDSRYYVYIKSDKSMDTHFDLYYDLTGEYKGNTYDNVLEKRTTLDRLNEEYKDIFDKAADKSIYSKYYYYEFASIETSKLNEGKLFGINYELDLDKLILDHEYDVNELAKTSGHINITMKGNGADIDEMVSILRGIKADYEALGFNFYTISLTLKNEDTENSYSVMYYKYEDIKMEDSFKDLIKENVEKIEQLEKDGEL